MNSPPPLPPLDRDHARTADYSYTPSPVSQNDPPQIQNWDPVLSQAKIDPDLLEKRIDVLKQLEQSIELQIGMLEDSEEYGKIAESQQARAKHLIEKSKSLQGDINNLVPKRQKAQQTLATAQGLEREWVDLESQMYRSIQPFSLAGLQQRLDQAINESERLSETLASSFLDTTSKQESETSGRLAEFLKNYRSERKLFHIRKERQVRWREERVRFA
jgi:Modifier of rudimentary (Mod(r)) protein